jgi:hypothetical protein
MEHAKPKHFAASWSNLSELLAGTLKIITAAAPE